MNATSGEIQPPPHSALCAECGWPCTERAGGCVVKLEVDRAGPPFQARVERTADGGILARVELSPLGQVVGADPMSSGGAPGGMPPACGEAVEALLAEVTERVRLVRGVFENKGSAGCSAGFESRLPAGATAEDLAEALGALSVACRCAGPEGRLLLAEPMIAESYLARARRPGGTDAPRTRVPAARVDPSPFPLKGARHDRD